MRHCLMGGFLLMLITSLTLAEEPPSWEGVLAMPQQVYLRDGRVYEGHAQRLEEGHLVFRLATDSGEVEYGFVVNDVLRLEFPGADVQEEALLFWNEGELGKVVRRMQAIYRQRKRFLSLMDSEQVHWFLHYVEVLLDTADYYSAIAVARQLEPLISGEQEHIRLQERLLLAYHLVGLEDSMVQLAQTLRERANPYRQSALSAYLPALRAADEGDWETALNLLLEPIVHSSQFPMEYLGDAYVLAIRACEAMGDSQYADFLRDEMQLRHLVPDGGLSGKKRASSME